MAPNILRGLKPPLYNTLFLQEILNSKLKTYANRLKSGNCYQFNLFSDTNNYKEVMSINL